MSSTLVALLLWLALSSVGSADDSSHYSVSVDHPSRVVFGKDGSLAALSGKELFFIPAHARLRQLDLPRLKEPVLLALGDGVWLRAGRTIAHASLDEVLKHEAYLSRKLSWQTLELAADVPALDDHSAVLDEQGQLLMQAPGGKVLRLTPSPQGIRSEWVRASSLRRPRVHEPAVCTRKGQRVQLHYRDESGRSHALLLPKMSMGLLGRHHELCDAHVAHLHGRVWFASEDHVFSQEQESWLVLSRSPSLTLWGRTRSFVRAWSPSSTAVWLGAACLLLAASIRLRVRERPYRVVARALGASLLAPPCAWLTAGVLDALGHGAASSTHGHGPSGALILMFLLPFALVSFVLPACGAWVGDRLGREGSENMHGHFSRAVLGTIVGAAIALPLTLPLVRDHLENQRALMMLVAASALVGVCTAIAYAHAER